MPHRQGRFHCILRHRKDFILYVFIGVTEDLIKLVPQLLLMCLDSSVRNRQLRQMQQVPVQPFAVRLASCVICLALLIRDDALLLRVNQKNTAGLQS